MTLFLEVRYRMCCTHLSRITAALKVKNNLTCCQKQYNESTGMKKVGMKREKRKLYILIYLYISCLCNVFIYIIIYKHQIINIK